MNFDSNTAPLLSTTPSRVAAIHFRTGWWARRWTSLMTRPVLASIPAPVEVFGHHPELNDEIAREILRLNFPALLLPEAEECSFILPHDDSGVGAADKYRLTSIRSWPISASASANE